jgi:predicted Zn-ribbon and HTH transcriptional regulator
MVTTISLDAVVPDVAAKRAPRDGVSFELRCSTCGYGVVVRIAPDACPMCRGSVWEHPRAAVRGRVVTAA